jgi:hypothetical protein
MGDLRETWAANSRYRGLGADVVYNFDISLISPKISTVYPCPFVRGRRSRARKPLERRRSDADAIFPRSKADHHVNAFWKRPDLHGWLVREFPAIHLVEQLPRSVIVFLQHRL